MNQLGWYTASVEMEKPPSAVRVNGWFCLVQSLANFILAGYLGFMIVLSQKNPFATFDMPDGDSSYEVHIPSWIIGSVIGVFLFVALVFGVANLFLIAAPRKKSVWEMHLVNQVLGLGSCIFTLPCLWLLLNWFKPEVRTWYGAIPPKAK